MTERRATDRRRVFFGGRIVTAFLSESDCLVRDLSRGGARIVVSETIPLPHRFDLVVTCRGETQAAEIAWRAGDALGVRFVGPAGDPATTLREELRASRAEVARLRGQLAEAPAPAHRVDGVLH